MHVFIWISKHFHHTQCFDFIALASYAFAFLIINFIANKCELIIQLFASHSSQSIKVKCSIKLTHIIRNFTFSFVQLLRSEAERYMPRALQQRKHKQNWRNLLIITLNPFNLFSFGSSMLCHIKWVCVCDARFKSLNNNYPKIKIFA